MVVSAAGLEAGSVIPSAAVLDIPLVASDTALAVWALVTRMPSTVATHFTAAFPITVIMRTIRGIPGTADRIGTVAATAITVTAIMDMGTRSFITGTMAITAATMMDAAGSTAELWPRAARIGGTATTTALVTSDAIRLVSLKQESKCAN